MTRALRQLITALLPFSFLWAFVACVSICEREALANHPSSNLPSAKDEIKRAPECDVCPLSHFPRAATPERMKSCFALISLPCFASATIPTTQPNLFVDWLDRPSLNGSPPLKLLSSLRI